MGLLLWSSTVVGAVLLRPTTLPARSRSIVCQFGAAVSDLKQEYGVDKLAARASAVVGDDQQAMLRALIGEKDADAAEAALQRISEWRSGKGKSIVDAAASGIAAAMATGKWDNEQLNACAPSSAKIAPYLGASQVQTLSSKDGSWLIYVIRAGAIDDGKLMSQVSKEQMAEYFAFVKEVHSRVAAMRTDATGKLVGVVTVNDLSGANLFGSSAFRDALSLASKAAAPLYPGLAGPTVLLNLPPILNALVKLFKPLFPPVVAARIKFEQGPLSKVKDLAELLPNSPDNAVRNRFLDDVAQMVKK